MPTSASPTSTCCSTCTRRSRCTTSSPARRRSTRRSSRRRAASRCCSPAPAWSSIRASRRSCASSCSSVIETVAPRFDRMLLDTGAGISDVVLYTSRSPTRCWSSRRPSRPRSPMPTRRSRCSRRSSSARAIRLVVNQVAPAGEGRAIRAPAAAGGRPLRQPTRTDVPLQARAARRVPTDPAVREAVQKRQLLLETYAGRARRRRRSWRSRRGWPKSAAERSRTRPCLPAGRLEQHHQRPAAALAGPRLHEGEHLAALHQPATHLVLEHRFAAGRAVALAVHHAHAAQAVACASRRKAASCSRASSRRRPCRSIWPWSVQWPRRSLRTTSGPMLGAPKGQRLVGVEQRFDVELVGDRFAQHGALVALALHAVAGSARVRCAARHGRCRRAAARRRRCARTGCARAARARARRAAAPRARPSPARAGRAPP